VSERLADRERRRLRLRRRIHAATTSGDAAAAADAMDLPPEAAALVGPSRILPYSLNPKP